MHNHSFSGHASTIDIKYNPNIGSLRHGNYSAGPYMWSTQDNGTAGWLSIPGGNPPLEKGMDPYQ
jgi:hypothetical protein